MAQMGSSGGGRVVRSRAPSRARGCPPSAIRCPWGAVDLSGGGRVRGAAGPLPAHAALAGLRASALRCPPSVRWLGFTVHAASRSRRAEIEAPDVFEKAFGDTVWKRFEALVPRAKTILRPIAQLEKAGPLRTR